MVFNCLKTAEPLREDSLLFTTKFWKFLVFIWSTSEGWKDESAVESPTSFEHGAARLKTQRLNNYAIAPYMIKVVCDISISFHFVKFTLQIYF